MALQGFAEGAMDTNTPGFWREMERRFRQLEESQPQDRESLLADWISTQWNETGDQWFVHGAIDKRVQQRFVWGAERAALALGHPGGHRSLLFWLDLLKQHSPNFQSGYSGTTHVNGKREDHEGGAVLRVCEASADVCLKLENDTISGAGTSRWKANRNSLPSFDDPKGEIQIVRSNIRRVGRESADFDQTVGKWMHEAHARLVRKRFEPNKGRATPNLPAKDFERILHRTDGAAKRGSPRFPIGKVLSGAVWKTIAEHNQKRGSSGKTISSWTAAAANPQFKRVVRYRFNRAEIFYRRFVLKQS